MTITCLIADDEPLAVQLLEDYIQQAGELTLVHKCYNAIDAHAFLKQQPVDLLFLDINMPKLTGMELTSLLPPTQKIIFTTAYSEYAVQSYEKNAVDYLLKPISFERFMQAVAKTEKLFTGGKPEKENTIASSDTASVFIKSGKAIIKMSFHKIIFIEGLKDYVTFYTVDEKVVVYKRMKELEETLPANFIRIHNSYIINSNHIHKVEDNHVFAGMERIPVSEKYRECFLQKITSRLL
jgi:two-component system, LytTR family, response regulator